MELPELSEPLLLDHDDHECDGFPSITITKSEEGISISLSHADTTDVFGMLRHAQVILENQAAFELQQQRADEMVRNYTEQAIFRKMAERSGPPGGH